MSLSYTVVHQPAPGLTKSSPAKRRLQEQGDSPARKTVVSLGASWAKKPTGLFNPTG